MMKRQLLLIAMALLCAMTAMAKKERQVLQYDIACAGVGVQGTNLVKVSVTVKKGTVTDSELAYAAVHGVIFRGYTGAPGCSSQRPMASSLSVEQQHADYFSAFFAESGPYAGFASVVPGSYERMKLPGKSLRVSAVVQVRKDLLRRELEQAGIVQSLSNGF